MGAAGAGDVAKGRKLAIKHCALCHVIRDHNPMGGIGSTPSFNVLANIGDWETRLRTFYKRRPHPPFVRVPGVAPPKGVLPNAPEFTVTKDNIDDLAAFVGSLHQR